MTITTRFGSGPSARGSADPTASASLDWKTWRIHGERSKCNNIIKFSVLCTRTDISYISYNLGNSILATNKLWFLRYVSRGYWNFNNKRCFTTNGDQCVPELRKPFSFSNFPRPLVTYIISGHITINKSLIRYLNKYIYFKDRFTFNKEWQ